MAIACLLNFSSLKDTRLFSGEPREQRIAQLGVLRAWLQPAF
jgi:hypothetical protein